MMRASGCAAAIGPAAAGDHRYERRGLADRCSARPASNSAQVLLERLGRAAVTATARGAKRGRRLSAKKRGSLQLGHEDLRVAPEHLVQRRGAALGVPDDEEVRQPAPAPGSVELVIAPERHQVAIEVLAERVDLTLEADGATRA